jgi:hypothetical protein
MAGVFIALIAVFFVTSIRRKRKRSKQLYGSHYMPPKNVSVRSGKKGR